ncbi:anti-sigma regulatory factor (Ser/Thr protein kinase) [Kineococcus radiotolerans]|uniref:Anti-sigma regulatory factor (Ser/Thr protein kinase) n=1 Tax=Kineococcus radiotolerans TaxID=131568 RepID=A0A7W4TIV4_KINRA|nr:ATP-binding protein [Kineococcus radiotolerans]MBB2899736.1 anti-sigma regulatory factor (Ser/Thr protein kinase) [Kineococcus radiotolerans]
MCEATPTAEITLPDEEHSARRARTFLSEAHCAEHHARVLEEAQLLVSELVTNAVRHGAPPVRVRVSCGGADGAGLQVAVSDGDPHPPVRRDAPPEAEGGRGVALVDIISDRWGVERADAGKTVWFVLS